MDSVRLLECKGVEKSFGRKKVLRGVDLSLRPGSVTLLLGPNGAGKTTLCRILALISKQTSGRLFFKGSEITSELRTEYKKALGYLSHQTLIYNYLTAYENLMFFAGLYGIGKPEDKIGNLLADVKLSESRDEIAGTFSRGMQQRLSIARLLLSDPKVLLLDEPFTGLDPDGIKGLTAQLEGLKSPERTVLMVTHELDDSVEIAEAVVIINRGAIVHSGRFGSLKELKEIYFESTSEGPR